MAVNGATATGRSPVPENRESVLPGTSFLSFHPQVRHFTFPEVELTRDSIIYPFIGEQLQLAGANVLELIAGEHADKILQWVRARLVSQLGPTLGLALSSSLGATVRDLQIDFRACFDDSRGSVAGASPEVYGASALQAISCLPLLESLTIFDCVYTDGLFNTLIKTPIKILRLYGSFDRDEVPMLQHLDTWGLRSLTLFITDNVDSDEARMSGCEYEGPRMDVSVFVHELLSACRDTLNYLKLMQPDRECAGPLSSNFLSFPQLETIILSGGVRLNGSSQGNITGPKLSTLWFQYDDSVMRKCLRNEVYNQLQTIIIDTVDGFNYESRETEKNGMQKRDEEHGDHPEGGSGQELRWLRRRAMGLEGFMSTGACTDEFNRRIIASLTPPPDAQEPRSLEWGLRKLSLNWRATEVPAATIDAIAQLHGLELLYLEAYDQDGWPRWFIDHEDLISRLQPLHSTLRRFVLVGDTYDLPSNENEIKNMKVSATRPVKASVRDQLKWRTLVQTLSNAEELHMDEDMEVREEVLFMYQEYHLDRMIAIAFAYKRMFPQLEYLHIGQMGIRFTSQGIPYIGGNTILVGGRPSITLCEFGVE